MLELPESSTSVDTPTMTHRWGHFLSCVTMLSSGLDDIQLISMSVGGPAAYVILNQKLF